VPQPTAPKSVAAPPESPAGPPKQIVGAFGIELVRLEPGAFIMGSEGGGSPDESPAHKVTISQAFYVGRNEVTQAQYRQTTGANPSAFAGADNAPVESVSWFDAIDFCNALSKKDGLTPYYKVSSSGTSTSVVTTPDVNGLGYRLPTEAEWEYGCRAGSQTVYWFGDDPAALVAHEWFDQNSEKSTRPVGEKPANAFALHDMLGNVREWCWDVYDKDYYKKKVEKDPTGPEQGGVGMPRVHRGGSWDSTASLIRSGVRGKLPPTKATRFHGFRVARNDPTTSSTGGRSAE
jgi:formylglycine-generating enzyme required for sulfatase activity